MIEEYVGWDRGGRVGGGRRIGGADVGVVAGIVEAVETGAILVVVVENRRQVAFTCEQDMDPP